MEGTKQKITDRKQNIYALAKQFQGLATAGAENGKWGYRLTYAIAYLRDFLVTLNILGETFATSVPWSQIHNGGSISHHHGLGIRADFIEDSQSSASIELVQKFKQTANSQNIFGISNNSCSSTASTIVDFSHE